MKRTRGIYRDENKNNAFNPEDAWVVLRKHSKWDAPSPAPVDLTKGENVPDEHVPAVNTEELFSPDARPRPPADVAALFWCYGVMTHGALILGRRFLRTACDLVDVHREELTLRVGDEKLIFNVESTSKYPHKHGDESINQIDIIDTTCEDHFHEVLNVQKSIHPLSGSPTPSDPVVASLSPFLTPFGDSDFEQIYNKDENEQTAALS
ncbi:hypothetical protein Tco_1393801 [Tanacetum coccineum]